MLFHFQSLIASCRQLIMKHLFLLLCLIFVFSQPTDDLVENPPGMPESTKLYSGYLDTLSPTRKLHYVFVESQSDPDNDPVVLWLNGGPGCSSLLGFLQEIGTYTLETKYVNGSNLTKNPYAWTRNANVMYLESPAGVGFSINTDPNYQHTDYTTADDNYASIKNFFEGKGAKWVKNQFFITGESYAGKYIPDLLVRILDGNAAFYINIIGIMVGNGVMNFGDHELDISSIQYMNTHNFLNPTLMSMFKSSCLQDYWSPRCNLFKKDYYAVRERLNPYNVYQVCRTVRSQPITLMKSLGQLPQDFVPPPELGIDECPTEIGITDYLRIHQQKYNIKQKIEWNTCNGLHYTRTPEGSLAEYRRIMSNPKIRIWLYNGDSDDVVPFTDTLKNLPAIGAYPQYDYEPWFVGQDHAGFYQLYSQVTVITVKGAGHMVPQDKRKEAFQLYYNFIKNRAPNTTVS